MVTDRIFRQTLRKRASDYQKITQSLIHSARVLNSLALGRRERPESILKRKFKLARKAERLGDFFRLIIKLVTRPKSYRARDLKLFRLQELYDNPYLRIERLDYLECITGIVSAPELYLSSQIAAQLRTQRPVRMDLRGFDALITTCPLKIKPHNLPTFVQTIHDLIPLEFVAHNEDPSMFSHRLQACIPARKLFVSQSTATKYNTHIQNAQLATSRQRSHLKYNNHQRVIVQSPSLHFPKWLTEDEDRVADLQP